jgi:cell division protein ZapE
MFKENLHNSFVEFCKKNKFEINNQQIKIIDQLVKFIEPKKTIFNNIFNSKEKLCFYLHGNVGVGKTMLTNFVYEHLINKKTRIHFNEFMINFHNYRHKEKINDNSIKSFVKNLKEKFEIIYIDEFQVTNIVDAMILGKLFEVIFSENIKVIITTNIMLDDLYKDGLQREQFLPFISIIKNNSIQKELLLNDDYRLQNKEESKRIFFPLNEKTLFKINQSFRQLTKNIKKEEKIITTKGRNFKIDNYYSGIARIKFNDLCDAYLGAEDYVNIASVCKHIFIEEVPTFTDKNSNQQLRFITLIDIFYEKNISLTLSLEVDFNNLSSSQKHLNIFKRTKSRLFEMTKDDF